MTDEEIVRKVSQGQTDEFEEIVRRYEKPLFGYVRKMINQSNEETEDLVQETMIKAFVNLQGFDSGKKFSSWIYRIAHNLSIDYFRKKKIKSDSIDESEEFFESKDKLVEELEIEKEEKTELSKAIARLDPKYKEAVILYYFEDKSYEEMADILHIPENQAGVILYRAKEKLKKILNEL